MAILITDDSRVVRQGLARLIATFYDGEILVASSGEEAVSLLATRAKDSGKEAVDLLLIDQVMEGMSGADTCKLLRSNEQWQDLPVVVMTASHEDEVLENAFESGANDFVHKPPNKVELRARIASLLQLKKEMDSRKEKERHLEETQGRLKKLVHHLEQISILDPLTSIANRRQFDDRIELEWRRARRNGSPLALLMIDIDFFKQYNDCYGHLRGDEALRNVAQALQQSTARAGDLCARYGGEEFVIILSETAQQGAEAVARRCIATVASMAIGHKDRPDKHLTISIGIGAMANVDGEYAALIEQADQALYVAKESGRDRYWISPDAATG